MPAISASAPGKVILFGEHAVVYGYPAIAVPVHHVEAKAVVTPQIKGPSGKIHIDAPQVGVDADLDRLSQNDPLGAAVRGALDMLNVQQPPAFKLRITSTIPLAAGLGSGAAVSVAIVRAVSAFLGRPFSDDQVSALAFEVEKLHHGTPSGIDNTVVTHAKPVYFVKDAPIQTFLVGAPFTLLIADTGVPSPTGIAVGEVRAGFQKEPEKYKKVFEDIGDIVKKARKVIEAGANETLGELINQNHKLLQEIEVSSPELDRLVNGAREAGAKGAKLSGAGRGGNMIALADENLEKIEQALLSAGAKRVFQTTVQ
jgi:mevalonate kinase